MSKRDALQFRPNPFLKCGSLRREAHIEVSALAFQEFLDLGTNGRRATRVWYQHVRTESFTEFRDATKCRGDNGPAFIKRD
jgi:hypothetical protein